MQNLQLCVKLLELSRMKTKLLDHLWKLRAKIPRFTKLLQVTEHNPPPFSISSPEDSQGSFSQVYIYHLDPINREGKHTVDLPFLWLTK